MDKFCYLGDMLDSSGGAESATIARVKSGWKKFRDLQPLLTSKAISLNTKGALYRTCVQNVMLYGGETWPVKAEDIQRLHRNEMAIVRWMCGASLRQEDCPSSETLRNKLGVKPIQDVLQQRRLRWFGHVERRDEDCWLKRVQVLQAPGKAPPGRPPKCWSQLIAEDLRTKGLQREMAQNRNIWRACIA